MVCFSMGGATWLSFSQSGIMDQAKAKALAACYAHMGIQLPLQSSDTQPTQRAGCIWNSLVKKRLAGASSGSHAGEVLFPLDLDILLPQIMYVVACRGRSV